MFDLSAIVIIGPLRVRAQRVINALCDQSAIERMELIIVDTAPADTPRCIVAAGVHCHYLHRPDLTIYGEARCAAIAAAQSPVLAFIEDHCVPEPQWAEALIAAHREDWAAIGYAFTNPNPENFWCRASSVNDYGLWLAPMTRRPLTLMPGNNISYKRECLIDLGSRLFEMLTPDYNLQQHLIATGRRMRAEPDARTAHQGFATLSPALKANFSYARLLAGRRAEAKKWSWFRRFAQAIATPLLAPTLGSLRLMRSLSGRESLRWQFLEGLPFYFLIHSWSAMGEAIGYIVGEGSAERDWNHFELYYDRDIQPTPSQQPAITGAT